MSDRLHESTTREGESGLAVTHQPDWFWDQTSLVSGGNIRHSKVKEINRKLLPLETFLSDTIAVCKHKLFNFAPSSLKMCF